MGSPAPRHGRCAFCGREFQQRSGPGRRKAYCDTLCRGRAQRKRDRERRTPPAPAWPWGRDVAVDVHALAVELVEAELRGADLKEVLGHAKRLEQEIAYYRAAAIRDARTTGHTWEEIAAAAGTGAEAVRARFSEPQLKRLFARRARERRPDWTPRVGRPRGTAQPNPSPGPTESPAVFVSPPVRLGAALSHLQLTSGMTVVDTARRADLSPSYVSRILAGERVPAWPVIHMLTTILGGSPEETRLLWEDARGLQHPARQGQESAAQRLRAALRGLHLAAGRPQASALEEKTSLPADLLAAVLRGDHVPDWPTTARLVTGLNADPSSVRPLWEAVHYAFLVCHDIFPVGGLPRPASTEETGDETGPHEP